MVQKLPGWPGLVLVWMIQIMEVYGAEECVIFCSGQQGDMTGLSRQVDRIIVTQTEL